MPCNLTFPAMTLAAVLASLPLPSLAESPSVPVLLAADPAALEIVIDLPESAYLAAGDTVLAITLTNKASGETRREDFVLELSAADTSFRVGQIDVARLTALQAMAEKWEGSGIDIAGSVSLSAPICGRSGAAGGGEIAVLVRPDVDADLVRLVGNLPMERLKAEGTLCP